MGDDWDFVARSEGNASHAREMYDVNHPVLSIPSASPDINLLQSHQDLYPQGNSLTKHDSPSTATPAASSVRILSERQSQRALSFSNPEPPEPSEPTEHRWPSADSPEIRNMLDEAIRSNLHRSWHSADDLKPQNLISRSSRSLNKPTERDIEHLTSATAMSDTMQELVEQAVRAEDIIDNTDREPLKTILLLIDKRMATLGLRTQVRDTRAQLRRHRERLNPAAVLQVLRRPEIPYVKKEEESLFDPDQPARTDLEIFLELEDEYNELEERLDSEEWDLKELESKVYRLLGEVKDHGVDALTRILSMQSDAFSETSQSDQFGSVDEPDWRTVLYNRYLSRKGDADILEEQLQSLRAERAYFFEEQRKREAWHWELSVEARNFSNTFDERHNDLQADLRRAREDASALKDSWSAHDDTFFKFTPFRVTPETFDGSSDDILSNGSVEMLWPLHRLSITSDEQFDDVVTLDSLVMLFHRWAPAPKFGDAAIDHDHAVVNMPLFINTWLLHIMQHSFQHEHFFWNFLRTVKPATPILRSTNLFSLTELAELVIKFWNSDGTEKDFYFIYGADATSQSGSHYAAQHSARSMRSDSAIHKTDRLRHRFINSNMKGPVASLIFHRTVGPRGTMPYKSESIC